MSRRRRSRTIGSEGKSLRARRAARHQRKCTKAHIMSAGGCNTYCSTLGDGGLLPLPTGRRMQKKPVTPSGPELFDACFVLQRNRILVCLYGRKARQRGQPNRDRGKRQRRGGSGTARAVRNPRTD